ncbi:uncharacterized protein LOC144452894 [Glandiceps talaboti]
MAAAIPKTNAPDNPSPIVNNTPEAASPHTELDSAPVSLLTGDRHQQRVWFWMSLHIRLSGIDTEKRRADAPLKAAPMEQESDRTESQATEGDQPPQQPPQEQQPMEH